MKNHSSRFMLNFIIAILLPLGSFAQDYWVSTGVIPSANDAFRIATDSEGRIFAGVNGTGVFLSTDGGNNWINSGVTGQNIMDIAVNSNDHIFALGNATVHRSMDHGNTWMSMGNGLPGASVNSIAIKADGTIFIGLYGQKIYRSTDNAESWTRLENGLSTNTSYTSMAINSSGHIFSGTNGAHIYRSTDNGSNWDRISSGLPSPEVWALGIDSEDRVFAGTGDGLCVSLNNGDSWIRTSPDAPSFDINDLVIDSGDHVFATNYYGGVWRSEDHGNSWEDVDDPVNGEVSWGLGIGIDNYLFCGSGNGQIFRSEEPTVVTSSVFEPINSGLQRMSNSSVAWGDYDNDGDLDILAVGKDDDTNYAKIYRNDGSDVFVELQAVHLQAVMNGPVTWGDYDNDGDLDILMTGYDGGSSNFSLIYRNDGSDIFAASGINLIPMGSGSVDWVDYDNDGDLDIFMSGWNGSTSFALIYQNNDGTFSDIDAGLPGLRSGSCPWGDYDNDGDLDLLLTGWDGAVRYSAIFQNDNGSLTNIDAGLTVVAGAAAWGDYDSDGDLDIILTGYANDTSYETIVYENDSGLFIEVNLGLPRINRGTVDWGDYDNDGDLDLLMSGNNEGTFLADIFDNNGGVFTALGANLQAVRNSALAWGDYDNDRDLDILLTGHDGANHHSIIYKNNVARQNTVPSAPENLSQVISGSSVTLSWAPSADIETPNEALTYNLRIGSSFGGEDIKAAHSNLSTGYRRMIAMGNVQQTTSWTINNLADGSYYWSVQGIDHSYAGSQFCVEQSFSIGSAPTVVTEDATSIASTTATLNATVNPNNFSTSVIFEYGLSDEYGSEIEATQSPINGTSDIAVSAELSGLMEGQKYNFRVVATSSVGTSQGSNNFLETMDAGLLPTVNMDDPTDIALTTVTLNGRVNPGDQSTSVVFEYGLTNSYGSQIAADSSPINGDVNVDVSANLTGLVENTHYHYRLVASNASGMVTGSDQVLKTAIDYPDVFNLSFTSYDYPAHENAEDFSPSDYRLFGLPGSSTISATAILDGNVGEDWQVYWDNGNTEEYLIKYDEGTDFQFSEGKAFWIIHKGSFDLETSVNSAPLNGNDEIEIPVHPGWNLITNPIMSAISWSTIQELNDISEPIWSYDGSFNQASDFECYQGYYYFHTSGSSYLSVSYSSDELGKSVEPFVGPNRWQADLMLSSRSGHLGSIQFGVSPEAKPDYDHLDFHAPRSFGGMPSITFMRMNWDDTHPTFASDIRSDIQGTSLWNFELSNTAGEELILSLKDMDHIPLMYDVRLIDPNTGLSHDLRKDNGFTISPSITQADLILAVGNSKDINDYTKNMIPDQLVLVDNYPNPFNPMTTIRYALPNQADVSINIYDIKGREVITLISTSQSAGWHTIQWHGSNMNGVSVEAGVYFAHLQAGNLAKVIRMVYLP